MYNLNSPMPRLLPERRKHTASVSTSLSFASKADWLAQRALARKNKVSRKIADYATPEEINALKTALVARFDDSMAQALKIYGGYDPASERHSNVSRAASFPQKKTARRI